MNKKIISYPSSHTGDTIHAIVWTPEGAPRGILQICHGMCEYIERYQNFASFLTSQGFIVCGDTHLGHKDTASSMEDLGYFAPKNGWWFLVEDEQILRSKMEADYPSLPYFLLGHSMGSFITREYSTKYSAGLQGYICCGTAGPQWWEASAGIFLSRLLQRIHDPRYRSKFLQSIAFYSYNKRFPSEEGSNAWISKNRQNATDHANDPYCQFIFTVSGFTDLFTLVKRISSRKWAKKMDPDLPILFISGSMDPVGKYGKGVRQIAKRLKTAGVKDVKVKLYAEDRHEILNEEDCQKVYHDILRWITDHS